MLTADSRGRSASVVPLDGHVQVDHDVGLGRDGADEAHLRSLGCQIQRGDAVAGIGGGAQRKRDRSPAGGCHVHGRAAALAPSGHQLRQL